MYTLNVLEEMTAGEVCSLLNRQNATILALREALQPFVAQAYDFEKNDEADAASREAQGHTPRRSPDATRVFVTLGDLRRALFAYRGRYD